jgi:aspartate aminotransferase-like enzyme|tara:strand:+ start:1694 stop:1918 length:225 start_codon:yes stop_codon:yes gene_type:complete
MNDKSNPTLDEMASEISEMEKQLLDMKKAYREKKYEGLKIAMDARKSADEAVNEELKSLGLKAFPFNRSTSIWW